MFSLNESMRYFLCPGATDMRKGMNTLSGIVYNQMGGRLVQGDVFIFVNRRRDTMKLLHAEDGGLVLYQKRLEEGTFRMPQFDEDTSSYSMEWKDLVMMVEGIRQDPNARIKRLKALRHKP